jgi:hypothetical protein
MSVRLPLRIQEGNLDSKDCREMLYLGFLLQLADTLPFWLKSTESSSHDTFVTSCRYWFLQLRDCSLLEMSEVQRNIYESNQQDVTIYVNLFSFVSSTSSGALDCTDSIW